MNVQASARRVPSSRLVEHAGMDSIAAARAGLLQFFLVPVSPSYMYTEKCGCGNDECRADVLLNRKIWWETQIAKLEDSYSDANGFADEWIWMDTQYWLADRAYKVAVAECYRHAKERS